MTLQINLTAETIEEIDSRSWRANNGKTARSAAIQESLDRYFYLIKSARVSLRGTFTGPELCLIADSCNGTLFQAKTIPSLWFGIENSIRLDCLDDKYEVDGPVLIDKIHSLKNDQLYALVDAVEEYWREIGNDEEPADPGKLLE